MINECENNSFGVYCPQKCKDSNILYNFSEIKDHLENVCDMIEVDCNSCDLPVIK